MIKKNFIKSFPFLTSGSICRIGLVIISFLLAGMAAAEQARLTEFDTGLRLLVLPQPDKPLAQVDVYLSLRGAAQNGGMAHLIEHLMFRSSENCPAGSLRDSLQLLTTYNNAFTTPRNIHTQSRCLPRLLPRLLVAEAERFGRLQPDQADLEHEKKRILGEHDFRTETDTGMALNLRVIGLAYGDNAAGDPLLGSPETIRAMVLADVDTFISRWIRPDHTVVLVSGPVEPDSVLAAVAATFGMIPPAGAQPFGREPPPPTYPRSFVTRSDDFEDHLAVGFRLPYGTPEEATIVHLAETIMEQENGNPTLWIFDDEAVLIVHVKGRWSTNRTDQVAANKASEQFYDEVRTVYHRVRDSWFFERNRKAHVNELRERLSRPHLRAAWRAQSLADDRDLPEPDLMATMVDSLDHEKIRKFFAEQFTASRAYMAFAAGRPPKDTYLFLWNRFLRLNINPYLIDYAETAGLGVADIEPVLSEAENLCRMETLVLSNGIPVHIKVLPEADKVYIGGVRTFSALSEEARSRSPGRLIVYRYLANAGYDFKGSRMDPKGEGPGWDTWIETTVNSLTITAHGPAEQFGNITAAMHKRMDVDHLNPFAYTWLVDERQKLVKNYINFPALKSYSWLMETVFGPDHPLSGWLCPDKEAIADWSVKGANKLHRKLCRTGNFQIVVTGDIDRETMREILEDDFGRLSKAEPGFHPAAREQEFDVAGHVVHDSTSTVAVVEFMFPPRPTTVSPPLGVIDLLVLERLFERRLQVEVHRADLDSVSVAVMIQSLGAAALPRIQIINRPGDTARIIELVWEVTARIGDEAPTPAEVSLARLQLLGAFLENLHDPVESRNMLLGFGLFGEIPDNPLAQLCRRKYGVLAQQAGRLFPHEQYAWTVTGDTTLTAIREIVSATR